MTKLGETIGATASALINRLKGGEVVSSIYADHLGATAILLFEGRLEWDKPKPHEYHTLELLHGHPIVVTPEEQDRLQPLVDRRTELHIAAQAAIQRTAAQPGTEELSQAL